MAENPTKEEPTSRRIHKRSWLLLFLFILIPWTLLSIPGEMVGASGAAFDNTLFEHGWPYVHYEVGHFNDLEIKNEAHVAEILRIEFDKIRLEHRPEEIGNFLRSNLNSPRWQIGNFYWSESFNWPLGGKRRIGNILPWGLLANLMILASVSLLLICGLEYRIRKRGGLLRFSILELLALISIVAGASIFLSYEVDRSRHQAACGKQLKKAFVLVHLLKQSPAIPTTISRLLDHKINDFHSLEYPLFQSNERAMIYSSYPHSLPSEERKPQDLVASFNAFSDSYDLYLAGDPTMIRVLNSIDQTKVRRLAIDYRDDQTGNYFGNPKEFKNDLKAVFPNLKLLRIRLCADVAQEKQLRPFLKLNLQNLEEVNFHGLKMDGAELLLNSDFSEKTRFVVARDYIGSNRGFAGYALPTSTVEAVRKRLGKRFVVLNGSPVW